jgi:hypothetical protein
LFRLPISPNQFLDNSSLTPVRNLHLITKDRRELICKFCNEKGACIQCDYGKCLTSYHTPCGLRNGIKYIFRNSKQNIQELETKYLIAI